MPKRKRNAGAPTSLSADDFLPGNAKLKIDSYEDVADSEDEFHINRDKVLLEESSDAKRRRRAAEQLAELSEEEVLGYDEEDSEDDLDDEEDGDPTTAPRRDEYDSSEEGASSDDDEVEEGWGTSKRDYYDADRIETEQDALDEEAEARRILQKRRQALQEEDFIFDEQHWRDTERQEGQADEEDAVYTEVLPQLSIAEDATEQDRLALLRKHYPEFEPLSEEVIALQPLYDELNAVARSEQKDEKDSRLVMQDPSTAALKLQALSAYLGSLLMYLALLTSPAAGGSGSALPMPPHELRAHPVMDYLIKCRDLWTRVQDYQNLQPDIRPAKKAESNMEGVEAKEIDMQLDTNYVPASIERPVTMNKKKKKQVKIDVAAEASQARRKARVEAAERSLADLDQQLARARPAKAQTISAPTYQDADSDIGDEAPLSAHDAAMKAQKKKSLRFYTSQIAQKANKRANAGRAAGGDDDLPYRERLKDRQARLLKEAEKRGRRRDDETNLSGNEMSGDEDTMTNRQREGLDQVSPFDDDDLEAKVLAKKRNKALREQAYQEAKASGGQVVRRPQLEVGEDGRREISYQIEKNKGLTPKRKKDVKNPRVKKRKRFEDKTKKLKSMKPVYQGGEGRGGYGGELTGIKKNLVKGVRL